MVENTRKETVGPPAKYRHSAVKAWIRPDNAKQKLRLRKTTAETTDAEATDAAVPEAEITDVRAAKDARDVMTQKEESSNVNT